MLKKILKVTAVLLLVGFSFFYTEKVTIIARNSDPIMRAIKEEEKDKKISNVNPIINKDEYKTGINGCEIDVDESYSKMRSVGEFKEELIVMKEVSNDKDLTNKYVIGGNNKDKKVIADIKKTCKKCDVGFLYADIINVEEFYKVNLEILVNDDIKLLDLIILEIDLKYKIKLMNKKVKLISIDCLKREDK